MKWSGENPARPERFSKEIMAKVRNRKNNRIKRKLRIDGKIRGTPERPRISVFKSNKYTYAQMVDDVSGKTLVTVSDKVKELQKGKTKSESAFEAGKLLAERAMKSNIKQAIFDREGYRYHGRVRRLAEGAREGGLEF